MATPPKVLAAAAAVLLVGVALSGCLTVFPARSVLSTDPRAGSLVYANVLAFEAIQDPDAACSTGSDTRPVYVPEKSERVTLLVQAHLTSVPPEFAPIDPRHFDLTISDGAGVVWVDAHLKNNDSLEEVVVEGPRPGAWTVLISWYVCDGNLLVVKVNDQFRVQMIVTQPV